MKLFGKAPLYIQIRNHLKKRIDDGEWKEGSIIPPEMELKKEYDVSRVTIRKALEQLVDEKILTRKAGFGTTVSNNINSLSNFTLVQSFTNEMKEMGLPSKTINANLTIVKADLILSSIFGIKEGDNLYHLTRLRGTTSPILYSDTYLLPIVEFPKDYFNEGSLYSFLAKNNIYFSHFEEIVSAVIAPKYIKNALEIHDENTPQLKRKRFAYDDKNRLIEYTETFYNSESYEYRTKLFYRK
ncbi:MAG: GntR family transcriptional regulator [Acholeplasmataceae bacterium]